MLHSGSRGTGNRIGSYFIDRAKEAVEKDPVDLIETLAERVAGICLTDPRVEYTQVRVHKPDAPIEATFTDVALTITRTARRA